MYSSKRRRSFVHGLKIFILNYVCFSSLTAEIVQIHYQWAHYLCHYNIVYTNILYSTTAATSTFNANASISSFEYTVRNSNISNAPAHFTANYNPTMSVEHGTVCDAYVLTRNSQLTLFHT
jgi:hypothetical protein